MHRCLRRSSAGEEEREEESRPSSELRQEVVEEADHSVVEAEVAPEADEEAQTAAAEAFRGDISCTVDDDDELLHRFVYLRRELNFPVKLVIEEPVLFGDQFKRHGIIGVNTTFKVNNAIKMFYYR